MPSSNVITLLLIEGWERKQMRANDLSEAPTIVAKHLDTIDPEWRKRSWTIDTTIYGEGFIIAHSADRPGYLEIDGEIFYSAAWL